ncbi:MAG: hypothetical protein QOG52_893 [Frankiaceae bacterium]|nr:hypothetical protein [Frankiaceae bacterium]
MVHTLDAYELRALFEHMLDGVLFTHPDGTILAANPAACSLLHATEEEVCAAGRGALTDPTDERWPALVAERARLGRAHGRARMRRVHDGSTFECEMSSSIFWTRDGQEHACVVLRDVTAEERLVSELLRAERQWRLTVDHAATGIALVKLDGQWLHVNPALCRIVGYSESELLSRTFQDITHSEDLDADLELLHQVVAGEIDDYTLEKRYVHRDGHLVWVRLHVALVTDEQGDPLHFVSQIVDISAERAQRAMLADLALRDALTAVANRGALSEALAAVPLGEAFDVAFVDVDDFKNVNDQFGHAGGDELLIAVARRLVNEVRPRDVVARVGGDEFAILLRDVGDANALNVVAQRLLQALSTPYNIAGQTISVTASIGIARATDSRDAEHLLAAADVAMYGAKRNGKNAFRIVG